MPQVHYFGQEGLHNVLVIDLLGPNLEDLFDMCGRKFTIKTVCMAAKQMVSSASLFFCVKCQPDGWVTRGMVAAFTPHFRHLRQRVGTVLLDVQRSGAPSTGGVFLVMT